MFPWRDPFRYTAPPDQEKEDGGGGTRNLGRRHSLLGEMCSTVGFGRVNTQLNKKTSPSFVGFWMGIFQV